MWQVIPKLSALKQHWWARFLWVKKGLAGPSAYLTRRSAVIPRPDWGRPLGSRARSCQHVVPRRLFGLRPQFLMSCWHKAARSVPRPVSLSTGQLASRLASSKWDSLVAGQKSPSSATSSCKCCPSFSESLGLVHTKEGGLHPGAKTWRWGSVRAVSRAS